MINKKKGQGRNQWFYKKKGQERINNLIKKKGQGKNQGFSKKKTSKQRNKTNKLSNDSHKTFHKLLSTVQFKFQRCHMN